MKLYYEGVEEWSSFCLGNPVLLQKLESLACFFYLGNTPSCNYNYLLQNLTFPHSLKKLTLRGTDLNSEDLSTKIGSLPHLQVLKLKWNSFKGPEWETVEGKFCSLKFLLIEVGYGLEYWNSDSTHFPPLEHIVLRRLEKLKDIPLGIGDISTLQSIQLDYCSESAVLSARKILDEQEELGNVCLRVRAKFYKNSEAMQRLASDNFQVNFVLKNRGEQNLP